MYVVEHALLKCNEIKCQNSINNQAFTFYEVCHEKTDLKVFVVVIPVAAPGYMSSQV